MRTRREGLHRYQRLTRPTLETVSTSMFVPRCNVTFVFETPHARPRGPKTTSGLDTSSVTPWDAGPGQRRPGTHSGGSHRSKRKLSAAITTRVRTPCIAAVARATASAVEVSSRAAHADAPSRRVFGAGRH